MSEARCQNCEAPTESTICWACVRLLRRQLAELPWYLARLRESAYGQAKLAARGAVKAVTCDTPGLPLNSRASELLVTATLWLGDHARNLLPASFDGARAELYAAGLSQLTGVLMMYPFAGSMVEAVADLLAKCERLVDLPPERALAGLCPNCAAAVYVDRDAGRATAECAACGLQWPIAELRGRGVEEIGNELRSAADMYRVSKFAGYEVPRATFYRIVARLEPCERTDAGLRYRWADVEPVLSRR